jgi:2-polyprenyl-3-methyl-5-hydroxy-6-metoxy-1,4-benzoquinol methylase
VQRLAAVSNSVIGIDSDPRSIERASRRLQPIVNASVQLTSFDDFGAERRSFDLITFVASIHHLALREALLKARQLLSPGGELAIVGLSVNRSILDWTWAALCTPVAFIGSLVHQETRDIGVPIADPRDSFDDIRQTADAVIPGAVNRRGLYYRYRLLWQKG